MKPKIQPLIVWFLLPFTLMLVFSVLPQRFARGATFTVTTTADSGAGSLREAIVNANATLGLDTITFNIAGSAPFTINLITVLDTITESVDIDGLSQPGAACATPRIVINGAAGLANGLVVQGGNSVISGLVIQGFNGIGIVLQSGTNIVECSFIGTDASGSASVPNRSGGIRIEGGANDIDRSVISGNIGAGILIDGVAAVDNAITNSIIGTNAAGSAALGNSGSGIFLSNGASTTLITGNRIAFNGQDGVTLGINSTDNITNNNLISNNRIYSNTFIGIDLGNNDVTQNDAGDFDIGPNDAQNFPVLTAAITSGSSIGIAGTLGSAANTPYVLEFFSNTVCDGLAFGEGENYLGFVTVTTNSSGNASFTAILNAAVPAGAFITATASSNSDDTSEFSACVVATGGTTPGTIPTATLVVVGGPTPTISIPTLPPPTPLGPPTASVNGVRGLSVRSGPYLAATYLTAARPGTTYNVQGQSFDEGIFPWYLITVNGITGWASGRYLIVGGNTAIIPNLTTIFDQIDGAPETGVTATSRSIIDIRRRPSGRTTIVATMQRGTTVPILGRTVQGGTFWLHVRFGSVVGWIPAAPVTISGNIELVPVR